MAWLMKELVVSYLFIKAAAVIMISAVNMAGPLRRIYDKFVANRFMHL